MTLQFHPAAQDEFVETAAFYEGAGVGLGAQFREAVRAGLDRIVAHPEIGTRRGATRRLVVDGFPFDVVYRVQEATIDVLALAHHRRRPGYWRRRV